MFNGITTKEPEYPSSESLQYVDRAKEYIVASEIAKNDWAKSYIENSANDRLRYAHDLDLLNTYLQPGCCICEHGAAPFVLSAAISYAGYKVIAADLGPDRFGSMSNMPFTPMQYDVEHPVVMVIEGGRRDYF